MSDRKRALAIGAAAALLVLCVPAQAQDFGQVVSDCESNVSRQNLTLIGTGTPIPSGPNQYRVPMTVTRGDGGFDIVCRWDGRTGRVVLDGVGTVPRRDQAGDARRNCTATAQLRGFTVAGVKSAQQRDQSTWRVVLNVANNDPSTIECWFTTDGQAVVDAMPQNP